MQRIKLTALTLLLLTPILSCVMTFCPMPANAAMKADATMEMAMPCHEQAEQGSAIMLMIDCMGLDLFAQSDDPSFEQSVDVQAAVIISPDGIAALKPIAAKLSIRAPPLITAHAGQETYLSTLRIRL